VPTLFLPQTKLEEWAIAEKADMKDGQLVVAGEAKPYPMAPAVHFAKLVTGKDERQLLNKVRTQAQLDELKAEQMAESVLLGETAYEVVTGYVLQTEPPASRPAGPASAAKPGSSETSLLADFLLNKL
jgi:hypothetical protein